MPALVRAGALGGLNLSLFLLGVRMVRGHEMLYGVQPMQEGRVMADLGLSDWPGPFSLVGPWLFGLKLSFGNVGRLACWLVNALRHLGIITLIVALELFCDHEVSTKALRCVCAECRFIVVAYLSFVARPLVGYCIQCGGWLFCPTLSGHPNNVVCHC
jgi:hypothetical protein